MWSFACSSQPRGWLMWIQRKCEAEFVYLIEGCGKTLYEINDTKPHTRIDMTEQDTKCPVSYSTQEWVSSVRSFVLENYHIFDKGLAKNTFTICNCRGTGRTNLERFFGLDNTHSVIRRTKVGGNLLKINIDMILSFEYLLQPESCYRR